MTYTKQEELDLNKQLHKWQDLQLAAIAKKDIDKLFEAMNDIERSVWERIAKSETHKDLGWLVWTMADGVIKKYC